MSAGDDVTLQCFDKGRAPAICRANVAKRVALARRFRNMFCFNFVRRIFFGGWGGVGLLFTCVSTAAFVKLCKGLCVCGATVGSCDVKENLCKVTYYAHTKLSSFTYRCLKHRIEIFI